MRTLMEDVKKNGMQCQVLSVLFLGWNDCEVVLQVRALTFFP